MSARSYLSIGDVLTLLRQEFPDVTISKIRFLESQGLVNPERTPSGYRKFYEHDVERLRWVLRQQRENFLPLKVIKDRLDDEHSPGSADVVGNSAVPPEDVPAEAEPVLVGQRSSSDQHTSATPGGSLTAAASGGAHAAGASNVGASSGGQSDGPTLPGIEPAPADAHRTSTPVPPSATRSATSSSTAKAAASTASRVAATPTSPAAVPPPGRHAVAGAPTGGTSSADVMPASSGSPSAGAGRRARTPVAGRPAGSPGTPTTANGASEVRPETGAAEPTGATPAPESSSAPTHPPTRAGASGRRTPPAPSRAPAGSHVSGASLSIEELASASGLDISVLEDLVEYGLMVETRVAGLPCFDEEALAVATLAAGFAQFGVEPRHLRLYKNAADREAGFVEQIVLPLVRQRNPEARVRANETADELARLGQQLRASLLRSALGDLLNG